MAPVDGPVERVDADDQVIGVVDRGEATRHGWLHRVASTGCRGAEGRVLVHRSRTGRAEPAASVDRIDPGAEAAETIAGAGAAGAERGGRGDRPAT
ncbi:hypothetical protein [Kitasatospora sp. NBC_00458]|uniref:hypothetical protein n=1 Tax=Kitasatospora sp. NBC_00458 TaxID=2903568 RepID=UPI003FA5576E